MHRFWERQEEEIFYDWWYWYGDLVIKSLKRFFQSIKLNICDSTHQKGPVVSEDHNWLFAIS